MRKLGIISDRRSQLAAKFSLVKTLLFFLPLCALFLYRVQLLEANAYYGFIDMHIDAIYIGIYFIWMTVVVLTYPSAVKCPSDVFIALYIVTVMLCGSVFWSSTGLLDAFDALLLLILSTLPILTLRMTRRILVGLFNKHLVGVNICPEYLFVPALIVILLMSGMVGYMVSGNEGGFDVALMYERRMAGRGSFGDATLSAYLMAMSVNGLAPLFAFIAAQRSNITYAAISFAFAIFGFWLLGLKAPILYVGVMYIMGYILRRDLYKKIPKYVIFGLTAIFAVAILEYVVFGYSFVTDYFIRRLFLVGSEIQTYFFDKIFNQSSIDSILFGLHLDDSSTPSFLIGLEYFKNEATNANTNAFLYSLALSGLVGYFLCIIFICLFMSFLDYLFVFKRRGEVFAIAVIYSILLLEQAYTTAFISSGVLLCMVLVVLFSKRSPMIKVKK